MLLAPGTHTFGPDNATLTVHTTKTGAAARAGHNLVIEVRTWSATADVGDETTMSLIADSHSLRVIEASGGMQPLGDEEMASIAKTIDAEVLQGTTIAFASTEVRETADGEGLAVTGELELNNVTHPVSFELRPDGDGGMGATAVFRQSDWGMKPYSALFGTLKVVDEVEVSMRAKEQSSG